MLGPGLLDDALHPPGLQLRHLSAAAAPRLVRQMHPHTITRLHLPTPASRPTKAAMDTSLDLLSPVHKVTPILSLRFFHFIISLLQTRLFGAVPITLAGKLYVKLQARECCSLNNLISSSLGFNRLSLFNFLNLL